jgi:hypothetical protein
MADPPLLDLIENVSDEMEAHAGQWLAPRPSDPDLTTTLLFDIERTGTSLRLMANDRRVGIRTLTAIGTATSAQPESGGIYTSLSLANVLLRPRPTTDGPATSLVLTSGTFYRGYNTVSVTGSFGPARIAPRVREIAVELVILALNYQPLLTSETVGDWSRNYADSSAMNYTKERAAILSTLPGVVAI